MFATVASSPAPTSVFSSVSRPAERSPVAVSGGKRVVRGLWTRRNAANIADTSLRGRLVRLRHSPGFTAWSHGWAYLPPFSDDGDYLRWAVSLPKAGPRQVSLRWSDESNTIRVGIPGRKIGEADRQFVREKVRWMFRADEDFTEFWKQCRGHGVLRHCKANRTGSLLRCPTVFEDVVKTICTINAHWRNTKTMVTNLCRMFGEACPGDCEA
jgi:hypothetical protein